MKILLIDIVRDLADIATYTPAYSGDGSLPNPSDELATVMGLAGRLRTRVNALLDLVNAAPGEALTGWTDAHRKFFREWLRKTFPNEASAATIALGDAWMDGLRVGASVGLVRAEVNATARPDTTASPLAVEFAGVAEALDARSGEWRTSAGCHESLDGHPVGEYPYSETLRCDLGAGCVNCGGIGAVWDRDVDAAKVSTASVAASQREQHRASTCCPVAVASALLDVVETLGRQLDPLLDRQSFEYVRAFEKARQAVLACHKPSPGSVTGSAGTPSDGVESAHKCRNGGFPGLAGFDPTHPLLAISRAATTAPHDHEAQPRGACTDGR